LGEKLQDLFDMIEVHTENQEPSRENLDDWQSRLAEIFENLCNRRYGEEIQKSRAFLQSLKLSDEEQFRLLTDTPNVRTAVPDVPSDQIERKVDGIRLLNLGESLCCGLFGFDTGCRWGRAEVNIAAANLARIRGTRCGF
jgi:hypothetical protein